MHKFNKEEKDELLRMAQSQKLRDDMRNIRKNRFNPFLKSNGEIDADKYIAFLSEYNRFINHAPKPFHKISDKDMRL